MSAGFIAADDTAHVLAYEAFWVKNDQYAALADDEWLADDREDEEYDCNRCCDEGHSRGCYDCGRVSEVDEAAETAKAEDRRAFGGACRKMQIVLNDYALPSEWADAKAWMRLFEFEYAGNAALDKAISWIAEGWTDPEIHSYLHAASATFDSATDATAGLARVGLTPSKLESEGIPTDADTDDLFNWMASVAETHAKRQAS